MNKRKIKDKKTNPTFRKMFLRVIALVMMLPCLPASQVCALLPDTNQLKCYDAAGNEIVCPQPGGSFYGQDANYSINDHSYTKLDTTGSALPDTATSWVMVRDNLSGLIWEVKNIIDGIQDYANPNDADNTYTWYDSNPATNGGNEGTGGNGTDTEDFINYLNAAQFGGFSDWRLPTIRELALLIDRNTYNPAINASYFPSNTLVDAYWSTTTDASSPGNAWYVWLPNGTVYNTMLKSTSNYAMAVRGGQVLQNFIDNNDGTITDTSTSLMWQQDGLTNGNWGNALAYCENLILNNDGSWTSSVPNASGIKYDDWRLPNVNELQTLINYNLFSPAINTTYFPDTVSYFYWSSTTDVLNTDTAWYVIFSSGFVYYSNKMVDLYVRAVRGGQCGFYGDWDGDGVCDDGDQSGTAGDNPCTGGGKVSCDDNCPGIADPHQQDTDDDTVGDLCDVSPGADDRIDTDADGVPDACDVCPGGDDSIDTDADGVPDACDDQICGNSIIELPEECDDGNTFDCDGCSSFCMTELSAPSERSMDGWACGGNWNPAECCSGKCGIYVKPALFETFCINDVSDIGEGACDWGGGWYLYDGSTDGVNICCSGVKLNVADCDRDNDGIPDISDNCRDICNVGQQDADSDGIGDVCDPDPGCGHCAALPCELECLM